MVAQYILLRKIYCDTVEHRGETPGPAESLRPQLPDRTGEAYDRQTGRSLVEQKREMDVAAQSLTPARSSRHHPGAFESLLAGAVPRSKRRDAAVDLGARGVVRKCAKQNSVGSKGTVDSWIMSDPRHDDSLVEIEAALELLRQVKEDTFNLDHELATGGARPRDLKSSGRKGSKSGWRRWRTSAVRSTRTSESAQRALRS